jgi:hypothetical protein
MIMMMMSRRGCQRGDDKYDDMFFCTNMRLRRVKGGCPGVMIFTIVLM